MNDRHLYRMYSSAWTGVAPRSRDQRWPSAPIRPHTGFWRRALVWFCGF